MPNLLTRLFRRSPDEITRFSLSDYLRAIADGRFGMTGLGSPAVSYAQGRPAEKVENSFSGYVYGGYKANPIVFGVMTKRASVFSEARFMWRRFEDGRPGDLFSDGALKVLNRPWPNGTTGELLVRMIQDVDLAGNCYLVNEGDRLRRLRPDWVQIVLSGDPRTDLDVDVIGYSYTPGSPDAGDGRVYLPDEVMHWSPIPDPDALYRGMSWLTPVVREIQGDSAAVDHKLAFFANGATLGPIVKVPAGLTVTQFKDFITASNEAHQGVQNAYRPMYVGGGADVTLGQATMQQMDFKSLQGGFETRVCVAGQVPAVIVGVSEGLAGSSLNAGNYNAAKRSFVDGTLRPLWRSACAALATIVDVPADAELWWDERDIAYLREDMQDLAAIQQTQASTINTLITAGFEPDTTVPAVVTNDFTALKHSGMTSVQLQPPGTTANGAAATDAAPAVDPAATAGEDYAAALESFRSDLAETFDEIERKFELDEDDATGVVFADAYATTLEVFRVEILDEDSLLRAADYYDVRNPKGSVGGGRFRSLADRVTAALNGFLNGDGADDPLEPFTRDQLRKASKDLGLPPRRGASAEEIKLGLLTDARKRFRAEKDNPTPKPDAKFTLKGGGTPDPARAREVEVDNKIRAAYRAVLAREGRHDGGSEWVGLADLRNELGEGTNRHEVDAALKRLAVSRDAGSANVVPESNQKTLTQADRAAAVHFGDQDKHAISFEDASPQPVPGASKYRNKDVGVYREADGKVSLYEESGSGARGARVVTVGNLAGLERWANDNGETELADWARSEGGTPAVPTPAKAAPAKRAPRKATPSADLTGADGLSDNPAVRNVQIENRVRLAYSETANEAGWTQMTRLRRNRNLKDVSREEVDAAMDRLIEEPGVFMYHELNQKVLTPADRAAAVNIGGEPRHNVRIGDPSLRPLPAPAAKAAPRKAVPKGDLTGANGLSSDPAAPRTPTAANPPSLPLTAPYAERLAGLAGALRETPVRVEPLTGGVIAESVERVFLADGRSYVRKAERRDSVGQHRMTHEVLASQVFDALGVEAPAVVRIDDYTIAVEFVPGPDGGASGVLKAPSWATSSPAGRLLGFADALMGHRDRAGGNWKEQPGRQIVPLDNAGAFGSPERAAAGNPFAAYLMGRHAESPWKSRIELPAGLDLTEARRRLTALRPEFEAAGAGRQHREMMGRLDEIERRAVPQAATTGPSPTPKPPTASTPDATLATLRDMPTETRRDALDLRKMDDLKAMLRESGLPVSGRKRDLVDRLVGHLDGGSMAPAKTASAKDRRVATMASRLHEDWRKTRLQGDGSFEPRVKATKDEAWIAAHGTDQVDIANTDYADLPEDWKAENRAAAEVIDNILQRDGGKVDLSDRQVRDQVGEEIHQEWLKRNDWAKGGELDVPFVDLPKSEQDKDIDQLRVAMGGGDTPGAGKKAAPPAAPGQGLQPGYQLHVLPALHAPGKYNVKAVYPDGTEAHVIQDLSPTQARRELERLKAAGLDAVNAEYAKNSRASRERNQRLMEAEALRERRTLRRRQLQGAGPVRLREQLAAQGLDTSGTTAQLISRLLDAEGLGEPSRAAVPKADGGQGSSFAARSKDVAARATQEPSGDRSLGGGTSHTRLLEYPDGSKLVHKDQTRDPQLDAKELTDAEELGALVVNATGSRAPAVSRDGPDKIYLEWIASRPGSLETMSFKNPDQEILDSRDGRLLGLADALMLNSDRSTGNWLMAEGGSIVGIDNGFAFQLTTPAAAAASPFGRHFVTKGDVSEMTSLGAMTAATWSENDMSPADMAVIRARLEALRPDFARLGRESWWTAMMGRMDAMTANARGTGSRRP